MIYQMHNGHFVAVGQENIRTRKCGERTEAYVQVATSSNTIAGVHRYTCSTAARSCRIARVLLKQELSRAMREKDRPGYTHD